MTVMDPDALAELVAEVVNERFEGSLAEAVRETKEPGDKDLYRTAHRLRHGERPRIKRKTFNWLCRLLGKANYDRLLAALIIPEAQRAIEAYTAWYQDESDRILEGAPAGGQGPRTAALRRLRRSRCHAELLAGMRRAAPHAFAELKERTNGRLLGARRELARLRLTEPFLASEDSGGIERRWDELSREEAVRYVEVAVARELILLDRPSDVQRAQARFGKHRPAR